MAENIEKQDGVNEIQNAISKTEAFIEKNKSLLSYIVLGIIILAVLLFLFNKYYVQARAVEAQDEIAKTQILFQNDDFLKALNGNGKDTLGFAEIADEYSLTPTGNAANAYAAICCYKLGKYQDAIEYGKDFDSDDVNVSVEINTLIGDAYVELDDYEDALEYFKKAYEAKNTQFSPRAYVKAGIVLEEQKKYDEAIELYTIVKNQYPASTEAQIVDKYIERATINAGK